LRGIIQNVAEAISILALLGMCQYHAGIAGLLPASSTSATSP
jgi:hypothetical protein